ncbi:MAG TPA: tRNA lysidine(34) synthetase TilS, partial [Burkholderiaceae bacterium]|nr:tRNA lysidine(34) synthetase TilS [Burkholderiaceae bacterium]
SPLTVGASPLAVGSSALSLSAWRKLPEGSRAGVLRQWLSLHGARMPSRARLAEMLRQLDAQAADGLEIRHDGFVLRRYRGQAMLLPEAKSPQVASSHAPVSAASTAAAALASTAAAAPASAVATAPAVPLRWCGERRIEIPGRGAVLSIEPVDQRGQPGLARHWLQAPDLELRERIGGERLRMHAGGPHRSLKNLYQERGVPPWARRALPLLWARGRPIWAAGIGCDADCLVTEGVRYALDWRSLQPSPSASASGGSQD